MNDFTVKSGNKRIHLSDLATSFNISFGEICALARKYEGNDKDFLDDLDDYVNGGIF